VGRRGEGFGYKILYGRAFRAPTFRELAFDLPSGEGNPDLKLVKADEMALALSWKRNRLRLEAHPFLNLVSDTVALPGLPQPGNPLTFTNSAGVRVLGIELLAGGGFSLNDSWFANLTLQDPKDRESDERVPGLPSALFSAGVSLEIRGRVRVTPSLIARSSRPRALDDSRAKAPGYVLFGVTARSKPLWRTLELGLSLDNLFGKSYTDPAFKNGVPGDYPRPGRRVLLHASYKF
jgi:iron complex outermembrane receptor protein